MTGPIMFCYICLKNYYIDKNNSEALYIVIVYNN